MPKQNLKILYLITKSNYGGCQKYVLEMAKSAKDAGNDVTVACGGTGEAGAPTGKLVIRLQEANIPVIKVSHFLRDMSFLSDILAFFEVWKIIRKQKPNVLHVNSSKAGGIGALAGRLSGAKNIVFTAHGLASEEVWRPRLQRVLISIGTWFTIKLSHKSILISSELYEKVKKMPGLSNKVFLIKNGVSSIDFLDRATSRKELVPEVSEVSEVSEKAFWVGGIGELHPNKNWASAITAMISLPEKIHLMIIGEGEERKKLESLISENSLQNRVHLLGFKDAPKYLKAFDVFILPSKKEGLPYVLLEAGLASLPTIASDLPGNKDIIKTGQNGFLVEATPKMLATTLEMLWRDEGMRRNMGDNLKATVLSEFSIKKMLTQTMDLYESNMSGA
jgi:glycosyltransferase involved in cell wall biosynthesis